MPTSKRERNFARTKSHDNDSQRRPREPRPASEETFDLATAMEEWANEYEYGEPNVY